MTLEVFVTGDTIVGDTLTATISTVPPPPPPPPPTVSPRFKDDTDWRFVVIDRDSFAVLTFLDGIAFNRDLYFELNVAAYASGDVASDNPEVHTLHTDGAPFLDFNDRFLLGLRREGAYSSARPAYMNPAAPWVPRFHGLITQIQRQAQTGQPVSHFTAYDPLAYWDSRPVVDANGVIPGTDGITYIAAAGRRGNEILIDLLTNALAHGSLYVDFGQTDFYGGVIEDTDHLQMIFQGGGYSLASAVKDLTATGTLDIILTPIYDPLNRPGIIAELSIYNKAGSDKNEAIFAWDMPSRSLNNINLLHDGAQMANIGTVWLPTANKFVPVQEITDSKDFYGGWWLLGQSAYGSVTTNLTTGPGAPGILAAQELQLLTLLKLQSLGKTTISIDPTPERSPIPWNEYFLGDNVPVYASLDFGEALDPGDIVDGRYSRLLRVNAIPLTLDDDSVEMVVGMLLTYAEPQSPPHPPIDLRFSVLSAARPSLSYLASSRLAPPASFTSPLVSADARRAPQVVIAPTVTRPTVYRSARPLV